MNTYLVLKLVHLKPFERLLYNVFITVNLQFLILAKEAESGCVPKYSGPRLMMDRYLAGPPDILESSLTLLRFYPI